MPEHAADGEVREALADELARMLARARFGYGVDMGGAHNPLPSEIRAARLFVGERVEAHVAARVAEATAHQYDHYDEGFRDAVAASDRDALAAQVEAVRGLLPKIERYYPRLWADIRSALSSPSSGGQGGEGT